MVFEGSLRVIWIINISETSNEKEMLFCWVLQHSLCLGLQVRVKWRSAALWCPLTGHLGLEGILNPRQHWGPEGQAPTPQSRNLHLRAPNRAQALDRPFCKNPAAAHAASVHTPNWDLNGVSISRHILSICGWMYVQNSDVPSYCGFSTDESSESPGGHKAPPALRKVPGSSNPPQNSSGSKNSTQEGRAWSLIS